MSIDRFPIGLEMDVSYPTFQVSLTLLSVTQLRFKIEEGPFARIEIVDIHVITFSIIQAFRKVAMRYKRSSQAYRKTSTTNPA